jgi:hypothetical protein
VAEEDADEGAAGGGAIDRPNSSASSNENPEMSLAAASPAAKPGKECLRLLAPSTELGA